MAVLFAEKVLSWDYLWESFIFISQANKKLGFFLSEDMQFITSREWKDCYSLGMKRNCMDYQKSNNWHDIDFILALFLSFWIFHSNPIIFTIAKSISEGMLCYELKRLFPLMLHLKFVG